MDGLTIEQWKAHRASEFLFVGLSRGDVDQLRAKAEALIAGGHGPETWDWLLVLARKVELLLNSFVFQQPISVSSGPIRADYVMQSGVLECDTCHTTGVIEGPYAELPPGWVVTTMTDYGGLKVGMYACPNCQRL